MGLSSGQKLGPYEIQSPLGAGGMGEVYRARDTRLDRTVAIKVLPAHLSSNPDFRNRFEREAKAISALQHPHICVLHDIGSQDGIDFLVMECLEGETLADRLARKPLTADEVIKIGIEIADALEKAHRSGIVHRDLKPGNVMLTKTGAKLMDFGLAKPSTLPRGSSPGVPDLATMATMAGTMPNMASPVTVAGTVIGTVQYMSPEQIQGKEADARSDIFAFGVMLYEMLTGKRAFEGKSQLSVASAILEKDPDPIATLQPMTPPALEHVVRTCLAKEPEDRFQSAHDLKLQLQWIASAGSQAGAPTPVTTRPKPNQKLLLAVASLGWLLAVAAAILAILYSGRLTSAQQPLRASIEAPSAYNFAFVLNGPPVLSPDGQQFAFLAVKKDAPESGSNMNMIFVRHLSTGEATPLAGTEGALFPFWSPDSKYLGFFADGKLKKIPAAGGPAQVLCDAPDGGGGSWSDRGTILFAPRIAGPLVSVSDGGGTPVEVTTTLKDDPNFTHRNPYFLPDGKHFLYAQSGGHDLQAGGLGRVFASSVDGGDPKEILPFNSNVAYSDGYLFYIKGSVLTAQAFNPRSLRFEGNPVSIAAAVEYYNPRMAGYFSVSRNVLLYRTAVTPNRQLVWLDSSGKELDHWGDPAPYVGSLFSPGSGMVVLDRANAANEAETSLWLADPQRKTVQRLTSDTVSIQSALVSSDGNSVFICTSSFSNSSLVRRPLTASGAEEKLQLEALPGSYVVRAISHDDRYLFLDKQDPKTSWDVYYLDLAGDKKLTPLFTSPYDEHADALSPDNKWLAYSSNETGRLELYLTAFPAVGSKWQVSNNGLSDVLGWSADGKNLRYVQGDKIYNVEVRDNGGKPEFSPPKELTPLPPDLSVISISSDGQRILATRPVGDRPSPPVDFVLNWQHLVH